MDGGGAIFLMDFLIELLTEAMSEAYFSGGFW
jgi:hypothetical protein